MFAIILGTALLFWLPIEDETETLAILFAILICAWLAAAILPRTKFLSPHPLPFYILAGILVGAAVTPLTVSLLAFKIGLHAHPVPDYTNQQIISVIRRTPIWLIGGFFISVGFGTCHNNRQTQSESYHATEH
jgi:hypothetical protein